MKSTVIIYTALVLVGTATGISIQQPSMASKGMESTNPIESRTSKKLQQIGSDKCEDAGIFDNVAYEIEYSGNCNLPWQLLPHQTSCTLTLMEMKRKIQL